MELKRGVIDSNNCFQETLNCWNYATWKGIKKCDKIGLIHTCVWLHAHLALFEY